MFANSSLTIPLHSIQNDLSQLQNQLLKFKLIISQSSLPNSQSQNELYSRLSSQLQAIQTVIAKFNAKCEEEIKNLQSRLSVLMQVSSGLSQRRDWNEDQKYMIVTEKISMLEQSLRRTQQNENKLIDTINLLMTKYHIQDQPTLIQNDQYLKSRIKTSQASSMITFQPCSGGTRQKNLEKSSSSRQNLTKTMKKTDANIYLLNGNNNYAYNSISSDSPQYFRTFSKPSHGAKISLKQTTGANIQLKFPNPTIKPIGQSFDLKDNRSGSLNRHQHRLRFMMDNLDY